ncbi:MAG: NirD/YgiW/YdeI family stress tolerance protein [Treponema sp.]|nr:NirD/YgiW/YdeI family stress tolerance protein [Treponema sp.]
MPISEAWNLPKDSWVIVSGNLVNTLPGGKYYTFRDFSGEITVEIEPKVWRGLSVGPSDKVMIGGEIEVKKGQVSIEVKTISGSGRMSNWHGQAVTVIQPITVGEAKNLPHDSWVILTGNIVNSLGRERYTFRDYSGEIAVEIEPKVWRGLSAGVSDMVEIQGELDTKRGQFSIEVKAIRKI